MREFHIKPLGAKLVGEEVERQLLPLAEDRDFDVAADEVLGHEALEVGRRRHGIEPTEAIRSSGFSPARRRAVGDHLDDFEAGAAIELSGNSRWKWLWSTPTPR